MLVNLDLLTLENLVKNDQKKRYTMIQEPDTQAGSAAGPIWWIRANQGHSIKARKLFPSQLARLNPPSSVRRA
jgi:2'-phosphotransferase